ncbi:hypothetical protein D3C78_1362700 [compost metagenome]
MRRVHGVRLDEFDLLSVDAARGVDFVDGKLQPAIALLSQQRKRAAEREEGAHFHVGRCGAACQDAAHAQRQNNLIELEHGLRSFVGMGCGLFLVVSVFFKYMIYAPGRYENPALDSSWGHSKPNRGIP